MDRYIEAIVVNDTFINDTEQHFFYFAVPDFTTDEIIDESVFRFKEELCDIFKKLYQIKTATFYYYWTDITKEEYDRHQEVKDNEF